MPSYEELYYEAKKNYEQAISNRNAIRHNTQELNAKKKTLDAELKQKQSSLDTVRKKKIMIQGIIDECKKIDENEFPAMKRNVESVGIEYKKIFSSDIGVADLSLIYESDFRKTESDLDGIVAELSNRMKEIEVQEKEAQNDVNAKNNELNSVTRQLGNVGSESVAQRQIDIYYTEMKEYYRKWMNGE